MTAPRRNTGGQAMTEYTIVLALTVVALVLAAIDPSPLDALLDAIRRAYLAFSYAISMSV